MPGPAGEKVPLCGLASLDTGDKVRPEYESVFPVGGFHLRLRSSTPVVDVWRGPRCSLGSHPVRKSLPLSKVLSDEQTTIPPAFSLTSLRGDRGLGYGPILVDERWRATDRPQRSVHHRMYRHGWHGDGRCARPFTIRRHRRRLRCRCEPSREGSNP